MEFLVKHCLTQLLEAKASVSLLKNILTSKIGSSCLSTEDNTAEVMEILDQVEKSLHQFCDKMEAFTFSK